MYFWTLVISAYCIFPPQYAATTVLISAHLPLADICLWRRCLSFTSDPVCAKSISAAGKKQAMSYTKNIYNLQ